MEGAKPLYEEVYDRDQGEVIHQRTGQIAPPAFPYPATVSLENPEESSRRDLLAAWITSPDNHYFARSYVNRLWGYLMGVGIIEPIDDIRAGNPPSNPELLDWLAEEFVSSGFDVQHMVRTICKSRTYQLSVRTNQWNEDDDTNFSHATPKRLSAEVLYDAIHFATGTPSSFPGVPRGTRAAALPDSGIKLEDGFLANLGRPPRESACECERSNDMKLGSIMSLVSGPTVDQALSDPDNALARLVEETEEDAALAEELYLRILNRFPRPEEVERAGRILGRMQEESTRIWRGTSPTTGSPSPRRRSGGPSAARRRYGRPRSGWRPTSGKPLPGWRRRSGSARRPSPRPKCGSRSTGRACPTPWPRGRRQAATDRHGIRWILPR